MSFLSRKKLNRCVFAFTLVFCLTALGQVNVFAKDLTTVITNTFYAPSIF